MPDRMPEGMPDRMPDRMSARMPEDMPDKVPECLPDRMPADLPDNMPEDMLDRMPDGMPEDLPDNMPDRMPDGMPEDMPEHMPEDMPEDMPEHLPEDMPEHLPEDMPGRMPEDMPDRMPDRMPENMSDRMPEDLPVTKCINVMVGITRSKVICWHLCGVFWICNAALVPTLNVWSSTAFKTGVSGDQWRSMFMSIVFLKSRVGLSLHSSLELPVSLLTFAASTTPKMHHLAQNPGNGNGGNYDKVWHLHSQVNRIPMHTEVHYWRIVAFAHELAVSLRLIMTCHSIWQCGDPTQALTRWARRDSTGINLHLMVGPWERAHHPGKPQSHMVMGGEKGGLIEVT